MFCHNTLLSFASRVDNIFKETRNDSSQPPSILKLSVNRSITVMRDYVDLPSRKRFRSSSPAASSSPKPFLLSRNRSAVPYRSQNHYKGIRAKCGKEGHSITKCRHATADEKTALFNKVKETKSRKVVAYQSNDKFDKRTDSNKNFKFHDSKTSQSHEPAACNIEGVG